VKKESARLKWLSTVDHKEIGILYIVSAFIFLLVGGIEALLIRIQLSRPENHFLTGNTYNEVFTLHGTTMIFLVVIPLLLGFTVYLVPLMIGASDMIFPRMNALGFWAYLFGGIFLYLSFVSGGAPNAGWFAYAPLSEKAYSFLPGMDYWALGLLIVGIGTVLTAINIIATILKLRTEGMSLRRVPLFVWMSLVNSFLILFAMPPLNAALAMVFIDRQLDGHFFSPSTGGSALLWQHYFWSFGHPEVYIMVLPAFGMISEIIPVFSRKPIYGYGFVATSTVAIAFLSTGVWIHHMFAVGLHPMIYYLSGAASMIIAVPTGVKIFNWIATMWNGAIRFSTAMLFALGFLIQFTFGGLSGVMFAVIPIDWQLTDTYFVVAHMHYVLFGGTLFAIMAGFYYWYPKATGRMLSERIGKWHFWLMVLGFNGTFLVQHALGMMGMPRRVFTYSDFPNWGILNLISSVGAFVLAFSVLLFAWNLIWSYRNGAIAGDNPWSAWTLEWATSSPPPVWNFDSLPPIRGRRPLWDPKNGQVPK
jgi:cytochrome c oxidase subunit I